MHSKDVGSSPVSFHFFLLSFNLLVCSFLFLILCRYGYIYMNLAFIRLFNKYARINGNMFN